MNTSNLKSYAPKARADFIEAVTKRANLFGISKNQIAEVSITGGVMDIEGKQFDSGLQRSRNKLIKRVETVGFDQLMEQVAYTWFNRLSAIRYMELHDYLGHGLRILSPSPSQGEGRGEGTTPEILTHAQDVAEDLGLDRTQIIELKLAGNQDETLYRELLIGQCHQLHKAMPFLFEALDDETELLLPDNLTRTDSLIRGLVDEIPEEDWDNIEIIGWLYQFYISEKKDQVIGKVVKSEDIPAATQLFTPNWIVKYMVQNSLGAQWLATYPQSSIKSQMDYYIEPAEQTDEVKAQLEAITPSTLNPEELTLIDPACGSGHILVEAYELFKAIYLERGYRQRDVARLILEKNLFGLDIDERAAQLTGFALMMKGRADDRRLFERGVKLNVMALVDSAGFDAEGLAKGVELGDYGLKPGDLTELKRLFEHATTFGSLIQVPEVLAAKLPALKQLSEVPSEDLFVSNALKRLGPLVQQAELLAAQYDAVVANPPYMGSKFYCAALKEFVTTAYEPGKPDLCSAFTLRNIQLARAGGHIGMITIPNWMFLSTFEEFRHSLIVDAPMTSLVHNGRGVWGSDFGSCSFVLGRSLPAQLSGRFLRLFDKQGSVASNEELMRRFHENPRFSTPNAAFEKVSGSPVAYWLSDQLRCVFEQGVSLGEMADAKQGLATADNDRFLRQWFEVSLSSAGFSLADRDAALTSGRTWFPYNKGGPFRRWYGNQDYVVNWERDGQAVRAFGTENGGRARSRAQNTEFYFRPSVSWSDVTSGPPSFRAFPKGFIHDVKGMSAFETDRLRPSLLLAFCNTPVVTETVKALNPTLSFQIGNFVSIPFIPAAVEEIKRAVSEHVSKLVDTSVVDWNAYERAWDFQTLPILTASSVPNPTLESSYTAWINQNRETIAEMKRVEEENNRLFIDAYGLADELTPDVPIEQITLTVNPAYRYGGKLTVEEQWTRFRQDTMAELVSYAIGCIMGRYRLDVPGLIYAHSGNKNFWEIYDGRMSDEWRVASEELSGSDSVAEVDGVGRTGLSNDPGVSKGGTVRLDQSDTQSSRFDSIQHSGRASEEIHRGVSQLSVDSPGFASGSGNPDPDSTTPGLCNPSSNQGNPLPAGRTLPNAEHTPQPVKPLTRHSFPPDDDGIIPLTDTEWFSDDAANCLVKFISVAWDGTHLEDNLTFLADNLSPKKNDSSHETIRRYLCTKFFKDHLKTYKKRPIYWLFSSGKQKAFECLVYLHRYNESTLARMRTEYVTPLTGKFATYAEQLENQIENASSTAETNRLKKELTVLEKKLVELREFDAKLKHFADRRISLDLDDGVKVNYGKFGDLLAEVKAITGKKPEVE